MESILSERDDAVITQPFITRFSYTREEMMKLKESEASNKRPEYLSPDYNELVFIY